MPKISVVKAGFFIFIMIVSSGCSVLGSPGAEIAPYTVVEQSGEIEVRRYDRLVLVSTPMVDERGNRDGAFRRLFNYISGENNGTAKIKMTAPVFTQAGAAPGQQIAVAAPVLSGPHATDSGGTMSFVLPASMDLESAPRPTHPEVRLSEVTDLLVAAITFSGRMTDESVRSHWERLTGWIQSQGYSIAGSYLTAGYNPPWTLPNLRRNEILIPIDKT